MPRKDARATGLVVLLRVLAPVSAISLALPVGRLDLLLGRLPFSPPGLRTLPVRKRPCRHAFPVIR